MSDQTASRANGPALDRRSLMGQALALVGAAAIAPDLALAQDLGAQKQLLGPNAFSLLSAIADTLVPRTDSAGAVEVKVPALFDALLSKWASPQRRGELTQAMNAIDAKARTRQGKPFTELPPETRAALLTEHDAEALKSAPREGGLTGMAALMAGPSVADPAYYKLKELIVTLYYMSEIALTQELSYEHAPGEWKPSIPVTPETHPAAGGQF